MRHLNRFSTRWGPVVAATAAVLAPMALPEVAPAYAPDDAPLEMFDQGNMDAVKAHIRSLSKPGALPGEPGLCGCDPLPQNYPDYVIEVTNHDEDNDRYTTETITVEGTTLETEHFAIHYPTSTSRSDPDGGDSVMSTDCRWAWDMNDVEDFGYEGYEIDCSDEEVTAKNSAAVLEEVWSAEIDEMGYPAPPMPNGKIDVIIGDLSVLLGGDYAGVAEPCADSEAGGPTDSRFWIDSSLTEPDVAKQVIAHEFFHVVQSGIDHKEGLAWMENTALWMQDRVAGGGYWGYAAWGVRAYDEPLTNLNPWQLRYGNVVWAEYLAEQYGDEIIKDIWLDADDPWGDDGMLHHYRILSNGIDGYAAAIHNFRYSLWYDYDLPLTNQHSLSRRDSQASWQNTLEDTTANYILFEGDPNEPDGKLKLCFQNLEGKPGLWARVAMNRSSSATDAATSEKTAAGSTEKLGGEEQDEVLFTLPIGGDGVLYAGGGPEEPPWGPAALAMTSDGDFLIADTVGKRVRRYNVQGELLSTIDLSPYRVPRIEDLEVSGSDLLVLDTGSMVPRVLRFSLAGQLKNTYELPSGLRLEDGLSGIALGGDGELLVEGEGGHFVTRLLNTQGKVDPGDLDGYPFGGHLYRARSADIGSGNSKSGSLWIDGTRIAVSVSHTLSGLRILAIQPDGDFYVVVEEAAMAQGAVQVDKTVRHYDVQGRLAGLARFPLEDQYTYVTQSLVVGPDGDVYALITRPDAVEIHRLHFTDRLDPILGQNSSVGEGGKPNEPTEGMIAPKGSVQACISRATILDTAKSYVNNSTYLSSTNIDGSCSGRGKPCYLGSAGNYSSVPYDWGGFDSVSGFNSYMASGYQAGDVDTSAVESCSKGVDCSGFVSRCWQTTSKYGTSTLSGISTNLSSYSDLIAGDAFNKPSSHVMLFNMFSGSGAYVYEATTGGHDRVVYQYRNSDVTNSYTPIRYYDLCDPNTDPGDDDTGDDDTAGDDDSGTGDDDDSGSGDDDAGVGDDDAGDDDAGLTGDGDSSGGKGEVHEVALDLIDEDCDGEYMEVDGFGSDVPWVALIVTFAGDPDTGDMCSGHGPEALCGHEGSDPPCGSASYRYDAQVVYPEKDPGSCSMSATDPSQPDAGTLFGWLVCLIPAVGFAARRRH